MITIIQALHKTANVGEITVFELELGLSWGIYFDWGGGVSTLGLKVPSLPLLIDNPGRKPYTGIKGAGRLCAKVGLLLLP